MSSKAKLCKISPTRLLLVILAIVCIMTLIDKEKLKGKVLEIEKRNATLVEENGRLYDEVETITSSLDEAIYELTKTRRGVEDLIAKHDTEMQEKREIIDALNKKIEELKKQLKEAPKPVSTNVSRGSTSAKKVMYMQATAYTAYCNGCSGTTATGINLRANPSLKVIAVDPNIIPLGTKVHVEGYGYAVAGDTGGAIKGNIIDVFIPSKADAYAWGRKQVKVTILN